MARFKGIPVEEARKPRFAGTPVDGPRPLKGKVEPQSSTPEPSTNVVDEEGNPIIKERPKMKPDLMGATAATVSGFINGIPVVGPMAQNLTDAMIGTGAQLTGGDYEETVKGLRERREQIAEANLPAKVAGEVGGTIASLGAGAATKIGAEALGLTGALLPRIANSAASGAGLSVADSLVRGEGAEDALAGGGVDAAISAALPLVGDAIAATAKGVGRVIGPTINAAFKPADEAGRRLGMAIERDLATNPTQVLNAADEAVAREAGVPIINADRGGETTRALARSVANQSPEARVVIDNVANDRFAGQGERAVDFIKRITGGSVDDLAFQEGVQTAARRANKPAYDAAYGAPAAQAIWSPEIRQLMQSPEFRKAVMGATRSGANEAAISGEKAVINPFVFGADGSITLREAADGSKALPSLQFWDIVQRNLRAAEETAMRGAKPNSNLARQIGTMRQQLLGTLDKAVPEFDTARRGAALFFGAEDALDAGKKFAGTPKLVPEAKAAFAKFSAAEKQAFATGYASELIDKIKSVRDRANVINQVFGSTSSREMIELVLGTGNSKRLEAYVRVEDLVDRIRGAMGNSTTARQLMELGIGAGSGALFTGGDWKGALVGAAVAKGGRYLGERADNQVMKEIAKMLVSDDPKLIQKAVMRATMDAKAMAAVKKMQQMLETSAKGAVAAPTGTEATPQ